jgi:ADP-L-glycero-D-manno-heptose 6-epimerase
VKIAVTGGLGFIGHELVERLVNDGHEVIVVDYFRDLIPSYEKSRLPIMQELYRILPKCATVVEPWEFIEGMGKKFGPQVVVHAGAVVDTKDMGHDGELFQQNLRYTEMLAAACNDSGACLIFISSAAVYGMNGHPNNPYGLTKALGEKIVAKIKTRTTSLRLFNVFGKHEHHKGEMASVAWKLARAFTTKSKMDMHSLQAQRDHVPSSTVVQSIVNVAHDMLAPGEKWHRVYDVGTGKPTSYHDLINMVSSAAKYQDALDRPINVIDRPPELEGRYQMYTCAGENGIENIGGMMETSKGILEAYGRETYT